MIGYKDNPNLRLKTVTTVGKKTEYRRNCKFIHGEYHIIDEDCHEVDGIWYRVNSGKIELDHESQKWFILKRGNPQLKGIVSLEGDIEVIGYYTPNPLKNVRIKSRTYGNTSGLSLEVLKGKYIEDVATGHMHPKSSLSSANIKKLQEIRNEMNHTNRGYNIEENPDDFKNKIESYKKDPTKIEKDLIAYGKLLGGITFGAEVEIGAGFISENLQHQTGVVICRDGSIGGGPELVTIPMSEGKGLYRLIKLSQALESRGTIDINCSFHLHIGTIPTDRDFLASVYVLGHRIQDEIFKMFPYYKTEPAGIKKKNYNQKLDRLGIFPLVDKTKVNYEDYINDIYHKLFVFLAEKVTPGTQFNRKMRKHPISQKWNRHSRYYWLNMMNMFFGERDTIEFRLHTATTNATKMITWLFICNAIIKYAEANKKKILTTGDAISMDDIFEYYTKAFPRNKYAAFVTNYLKGYFKKRCADFKKDLDRKDYLSAWDMEEDKKFVFKLDGKSLV